LLKYKIGKGVKWKPYKSFEYARFYCFSPNSSFHNVSEVNFAIFTDLQIFLCHFRTPLSAIKPDFLENQKYSSAESYLPDVKLDGLHVLYSYEKYPRVPLTSKFDL